MPVRRDIHEANRLSWNAATLAHNAHKRDQAAFLRGGGSTLFAEEVELLGDVRGKRVIHLQCNAGQDTLSLVRLGAAEVVGVDISDEAITFARALSAESGLAARFDRADVYDWLAATKERFDVAYASYGALVWLSDLDVWARGVAAMLGPGGRLCVMEFHPVLTMYDESGARRYAYFGEAKPFTQRDGLGDYVGESGEGLAPSGFVETRPFSNPHASHEFQWSLGEIFEAVVGAGLSIERFREYPYSNGCRFFPSMRLLPGRRYALPEGEPSMPMMFALAARVSR